MHNGEAVGTLCQGCDNEALILTHTLRQLIHRNAPTMSRTGIAKPVYKIRIWSIAPAIARAPHSLAEKAATLLKQVFITSATVDMNNINVL